MNCNITRRDFLNGVNIATAGSVLSTPLAQAISEIRQSGRISAQMKPGYYPPTSAMASTALLPFVGLKPNTWVSNPHPIFPATRRASLNCLSRSRLPTDST